MIIDTLLEHCTIDDNGAIACPNVDVANSIRRFLHEAIQDNRFYVSKVIGFKVSRVGRPDSGTTMIARNLEIGESYIELMRNLSDKVFIGTTARHIVIDLHPGENTLDNCLIIDKNGPLRVLHTNPYLCRVLREHCTLHLDLALGTGFLDMKGASLKMKSDGFPSYAYFFLGDFVRVRPVKNLSTTVNLVYRNGFTTQDLITILELNRSKYKANLIREEERIWMQSYGL